MKDALVEFGIAGLSLRALIDFLKNALKNSNAAVRTSATNTLVTLKLFAGSGTYRVIFVLQYLISLSNQGLFGRPQPAANVDNRKGIRKG